MKILGIETSCDDTGIAILETTDKSSTDFKILSNIIASQIEVHKKYGGVYPTMAKREHQKNLVPVLIKALKEAKLLKLKNKKTSPRLDKILEREPELKNKLIPFLKKYAKPNIDLISITTGPGLEPCLWVGINFVKALSSTWNIPIVPINHIESHILINYLHNKKIDFPALALVVSGGHTQLVLIKNTLKYKILGETRDDAAGECFDKCAKILGLPYPGGPEISKMAQGIATKNIFPRPMISTKDYDFSFSGLKTAVLYKIQKKYGAAPLRPAFGRTPKGRRYIKQMCAEIQQAIIDVLIKKTIKAAKDYKVKTIILGGGVSANKELKRQMAKKTKKEFPQIGFLFPQIDHSTDNGLMTAIAGFFHKKNKVNWKKIKASANLRIS